MVKLLTRCTCRRSTGAGSAVTTDASSPSMKISTEKREGAVMSGSEAMQSLLTNTSKLTFNVNVHTRFAELMVDKEALAEDERVTKEIALYLLASAVPALVQELVVGSGAVPVDGDDLCERMHAKGEWLDCPW